MASPSLKNKPIHEAITFTEATTAKDTAGWIEANYDYWNVVRRLQLRKMPLELQQEAVLKWFEQCVQDRPWEWVKSAKKRSEVLEQIMDPIRDISSEAAAELTKNPLPWFKENVQGFNKGVATSPSPDSWARRLADVALARGEFLLATKFADQTQDAEVWGWGYLQRGEGPQIKALFSKPLSEESYSLVSIFNDWDVMVGLVDEWGLSPNINAKTFSEHLIEMDVSTYTRSYWLDWCLKHREKDGAEAMRDVLSNLKKDELEDLISMWRDRDPKEYPEWATSFYEQAWSSPLIRKSFYQDVLSSEIWSDSDFNMVWAMRKCPFATELKSYNALAAYLKKEYSEEDFSGLKRHIKSNFEKEQLSKLPSAKKTKTGTPRL